MSKVKTISRAAAFFLVFALLFIRVQRLVTPNWDWPDYGERMKKAICGVYPEKKNTMDVFWLGTSHMQYGVSPMQVYRTTNIRSYNLATAGQPLLLSYHRLKSAFKEQSPKVVVLDASACFYVTSNNGDKRWLKAISCFGLDHLAERVEIAIAMPKLYPEGSKLSETVSAILPLFKFHSNYMLTEKSFTDLHLDKIYPQKGHIVSSRVSSAVNGRTVNEEIEDDGLEEEVVEGTDEKKLEKQNEKLQVNVEQLKRIIELCRAHDCELIMTKVPVYFAPSAASSEWSKEKHSALQTLCDELGIRFLDLNYVDLGLDWSRDTCDGGGHMNESGAIKVSNYLAQWLKDNYSFEGAADEASIQDWNRHMAVHDREKEDYDLQMEYDFSSYLNRLESGDYTVFCACPGAALDNCAPELRQALARTLGTELIPGEAEGKGAKSVLAVVSANGKVLSETDELSTLKGELPDGTRYAISAAKKTPSIVIDENDVSMTGQGISFVIYDNEIGSVVDSVIFDFQKGNGQATHGNSYNTQFRMKMLEFENNLLSAA